MRAISGAAWASLAQLLALSAYLGPDSLWGQSERTSIEKAPCLWQIDLLTQKKVTGVITQGARDFGHIQYVAAYKVAYSDDGTSWTVYKDNRTNSSKVGAGKGLR